MSSTRSIKPSIPSQNEPEPRFREIRPDLGFDRERAAYAVARPELVRTAPGQFVVFVGDAMTGPFLSARDATRAGWEQFGPGPVYVKQILEVDPIDDFRPVAATCRR